RPARPRHSSAIWCSGWRLRRRAYAATRWSCGSSAPRRTPRAAHARWSRRRRHGRSAFDAANLHS
ncbi:hypothetical protein BN1708_019218, partial [Verticillium longisporum]